MSLLIFSTSFLTRSLLWKNLTNDLSYFHDLSFRISHKFAFCEKFACENSHYAKVRILRKFACEKSHFAKIRISRRFACEKSHDAKIRKISHRFAKWFRKFFAFASLRKIFSRNFRIRIASHFHIQCEGTSLTELVYSDPWALLHEPLLRRWSSQKREWLCC